MTFDRLLLLMTFMAALGGWLVPRMQSAPWVLEERSGDTWALVNPSTFAKHNVVITVSGTGAEVEPKSVGTVPACSHERVLVAPSLAHEPLITVTWTSPAGWPRRSWRVPVGR